MSLAVYVIWLFPIKLIMSYIWSHKTLFSIWYKPNCTQQSFSYVLINLLRLYSNWRKNQYTAFKNKHLYMRCIRGKTLSKKKKSYQRMNLIGQKIMEWPGDIFSVKKQKKKKNQKINCTLFLWLFWTLAVFITRLILSNG